MEGSIRNWECWKVLFKKIRGVAGISLLNTFFPPRKTFGPLAYELGHIPHTLTAQSYAGLGCSTMLCDSRKCICCRKMAATRSGSGPCSSLDLSMAARVGKAGGKEANLAAMAHNGSYPLFLESSCPLLLLGLEPATGPRKPTVEQEAYGEVRVFTSGYRKMDGRGSEASWSVPLSSWIHCAPFWRSCTSGGGEDRFGLWENGLDANSLQSKQQTISSCVHHH